MPITLPYDVTTPAGDFVKAAPLQANFAAIVAAVAAGWVDADIASNANIAGTKLALNSIPGNRLLAGGVGSTQIGTGAISLATQIVAGIISADRLVAASLLKGNLKLVTTTVVFNASAPLPAIINSVAQSAVSGAAPFSASYALNVVSPATGVTVTNPITGVANMILSVSLYGTSGAGTNNMVASINQLAAAGPVYLVLTNTSGNRPVVGGTVPSDLTAVILSLSAT